MISRQEIRDQALALSPSERASLAHELILSLEDSSAFDLSPEEESEIQRRLQMVQEGRAKGRPSDEVFAEIKAKLS